MGKNRKGQNTDTLIHVHLDTPVFKQHIRNNARVPMY